MVNISIKFSKDLCERSDRFHQHNGVCFHRWLPDGENDAIVLDERGSKIKLWCERFGHEVRGCIEYDNEKREIDLNLMNRQGRLESGPLFGKIEALEISDDEYKVLEENKVGDPIYQNLGKRITKIIDPVLAKFFYIMRIHFGQFWIPEFEKFNSKEASIGYHLRFMGMKWSSDDGKSWKIFEPDHEHPPVTAYFASHESYLELISNTDWKNLQSILQKEYKESLAAITLARTHRYIVQRDTRHAFFEGVTAVELAIEEFIHNNINDNKIFKENIQGFWNLPISTQLVTLSTALNLSKSKVEETITAIKLRNRIVHDGFEPEFFDVRKNLISLLEIVSKLLIGPKFKFPTEGGQSIMTDEKWEEVYQKYQEG